ncbi:UNVERIFIED_CONTAM: pilus assembly protein CpaB [Acetivibrio alkalicellulosi]
MKNFLKNRLVIGSISIVLSLLICFGITPLYSNGLKSKTKVVRVSQNIVKGDIITADKISITEIGSYNLPASVLKSKGTVIGKYAKADLYKDDYILNTKVSDNPIIMDEYLSHLDGKKNAISITIKSLAAGLSGKLQNGDIISIIASEYSEFRETIIPLELQYVKVLAVTTSQGEDKEYYLDTKNHMEKGLPATVTLLVDRTQAKLLAKLEEKSKIHVSLVYRGSKENAQKFLDQQDKVIETSKNLANDADNVSNDIIEEISTFNSQEEKADER